MNNHTYSTLFKTQERESDRRSKEIEQSQKTQTQTKQQGHVTLSTELQSTALTLNFLAASRRVARLFPRCPETPLVAEGGGVNSKMRMHCMHVFRSSRCMCSTLFRMKWMDLSDFGFRPREKRQCVEHNISCHSQDVSVAMTASTSLSAGPSSPTLTAASSPRSSRSAARMRGDIGAYQMSELSQLHDKERLWLLQNAFLALYSETAAETILEGLKSKIFLGTFP